MLPGAGLDTFAYRNTTPVFERDHPQLENGNAHASRPSESPSSKHRCVLQWTPKHMT
ncbi:class I SAM-dependent methyltransferase [Mycobacteroides abscessus]|uniref:class I SAM-dependent methyltransferase n=1 Tax=Mycobacteroides abscessus TaxID=36809 RepID=UPI0013F6228B|nr:hypothetical protein I3U44_07900 [Mycobacteroides abscessus subsp. bolletii]